MVETVTYRPGGPQFVNEGDFEALNLYRPTTLEPTSGDVAPWLELVEYLIPDAKPRAHILDHFSSQVQRRGVKINHARSALVAAKASARTVPYSH